MKDDRVYLLHIRECVDHIREFTARGTRLVEEQWQSGMSDPG